mmetsp:Transcript_20699/g.66616  ORF Transcript_20699/g.66616 Transcript_20699/m.66616 type:complete len:291 (+) Transcript_20699:536-1408(+)
MAVAIVLSGGAVVGGGDVVRTEAALVVDAEERVGGRPQHGAAGGGAVAHVPRAEQAAMLAAGSEKHGNHRPATSSRGAAMVRAGAEGAKGLGDRSRPRGHAEKAGVVATDVAGGETRFLAGGAASVAAMFRTEGRSAAAPAGTRAAQGIVALVKGAVGSRRRRGEGAAVAALVVGLAPRRRPVPAEELLQEEDAAGLLVASSLPVVVPRGEALEGGEQRAGDRGGVVKVARDAPEDLVGSFRRDVLRGHEGKGRVSSSTRGGVVVVVVVESADALEEVDSAEDGAAGGLA